MKIFTIGGVLIAVILITIGLFSLYTYSKYDPLIAEKSKLLNYKDQGITLLDRNNKPFYFLNNAASDEYVPLSNVSPHVMNAILAAEDRTFYSHNGISPRGLLRSILLNMKSGSFAYGGSTLTQQLVKNTLLSPQRSLLRKAQEAVLALDVESKYTKNEILEMYVNTVYFGEGAIGIQKAAQTYFSKDAKDLTIAESAYLAGMLKFPSLISPFTGDKKLGESIQDTVLDQMAESQYITLSEAKIAKNEAVSFKKGYEDVTNDAPHYALMVVDKLKEMYGNDVVYGGYKVTTSIDLTLQEYAQSLVHENVVRNRGNGVSNGSLVAIDPSTGEVLALVGSANWFDEKSGKVNMATTPRQPGSSFKPIVYSMAMDQGLITPATVIKDEPKTYVLDPNCQPKREDCIYKPQNYDKKFRGNVTIRRALANSLNIPSVEVMRRVGIDSVLVNAKSFGITTLKDSDYYGKGLSLVLGTAEISPLEMADAYATFANKGSRPEPQFILQVKDKYEKVIYTYKPLYHDVISEETAFFINSILSDNNARSEVFGSILTTPFPAAVKTGTTENYRDAWTIGYNPNLVVAVWVGNNDARPIYNLPGSLAAAPIWKEMMGKYVSLTAYKDFDRPDTIVRASYCDSTTSGSARFEYFVEGTQPQRKCVPARPKNNVAKSDQNLPQIGGESNANDKKEEFKPIPAAVAAPNEESKKEQKEPKEEKKIKED